MLIGYQYQATDLSKTLSDANKALAIARDNTPKELLDLFKSSIHFCKLSGQYEWYWVLK